MRILPPESANQDFRIGSCSPNIVIAPLVGSMCNVNNPMCEWKKSSNNGFCIFDEAVPRVTDIR